MLACPMYLLSIALAGDPLSSPQDATNRQITQALAKAIEASSAFCNSQLLGKLIRECENSRGAHQFLHWQ
jgi:hypothetical protein